MTLYWKSNCSTCRKARAALKARGIPFEEVDLNRGLSSAELESLIGSRDYREFLNTRNELYRERAMKRNPPAREEAIELMSQHPNLIKRPLLVKDGAVYLGFDAVTGAA